MLGLIAIGIAAFIVFWDATPEFLMGGRSTRLSPLPVADSYMARTTTRKFDRQGRPAFVLTSTGSLYFQKQDRLTMDSPRVLALSATQAPPWHIQSDTSEVLAGGKQIVLHDNVYAWRDLPPTRRTNRQAGGREELRTSRLTLFPDQNLAETDRPVTLTRPTDRATGVGMKADLERETYQLLAKVKSVHNARR